MGSASSIFKQLSQSRDARFAHWSEHDALSSTLGIEKRDDAFTPLSGMKIFNSFTESEKDSLFHGFNQLNAEIIINLEQLLLYADHRIQKLDDSARSALDQFIAEELLHIKKFREHLKWKDGNSWRDRSLLIFQDSHIRKFYCLIIRFQPFSIFLPAAKSEIYSIQYANFLNKNKGANAGRWASLLRHHAIDEAAHIGVDFELLKSRLQELNPFQVLALSLATLGFFFCTQLILIKPAYRLIRQIFPKASFIKKLRLTVQFTYWTLSLFAPYPETRKILRLYFKSQKHGFFYCFRFMYW